MVGKGTGRRDAISCLLPNCVLYFMKGKLEQILHCIYWNRTVVLSHTVGDLCSHVNISK